MQLIEHGCDVESDDLLGMPGFLHSGYARTSSSSVARRCASARRGSYRRLRDARRPTDRRRIAEVPHAQLERASRQIAECEFSVGAVKSLSAEGRDRYGAVSERYAAFLRHHDSDDGTGGISARRLSARRMCDRHGGRSNEASRAKCGSHGREVAHASICSSAHRSTSGFDNRFGDG